MSTLVGGGRGEPKPTINESMNVALIIIMMNVHFKMSELLYP